MLANIQSKSERMFYKGICLIKNNESRSRMNETRIKKDNLDNL